MWSLSLLFVTCAANWWQYTYRACVIRTVLFSTNIRISHHPYLICHAFYNIPIFLILKFVHLCCSYTKHYTFLMMLSIVNCCSHPLYLNVLIIFCHCYRSKLCLPSFDWPTFLILLIQLFSLFSSKRTALGRGEQFIQRCHYRVLLFIH